MTPYLAGMSSEQIAVAPSEMEPNTFFIFRETGKEVKVRVNGGKIWADTRLTAYEANWFRDNILKDKSAG